MAHITLSQLTTVLQRIVSWATRNFAAKNAGTGILDPSQWPEVMLYNVVPISPLDSDYDWNAIPVGSIYLEDGLVSGIPYRKLYKKTTVEQSSIVDMGKPQPGTIYCHVETGNTYRWNQSLDQGLGQFVKIGSSGDGATVDPATSTPQMDGTANVGSSAKYAREDHVHPHDSTKANDNAVVKSISVNGTAQAKDGNGNVNIEVEGGGLSKEDISVETQGDGTVDINVKDDTYKINLNHTHENMAKLEFCDEANLPDTMYNDTIYAQVDELSSPTEIQKLYIHGIEFVGGGGATDDEPRLLSPKATAILDFAGEQTIQVFIRGKNLSQALSVAVTGDITISYGQSSSQSRVSIESEDAATGVNLTLTKGSNFLGGSLDISSNEIDQRTLDVTDSEDYESLSAVKMTGTQWMKTTYMTNANTKIRMRMKITENGNTHVADNSFGKYFILSCDSLTQDEQTAGNKAFQIYLYPGFNAEWQVISKIAGASAAAIGFLPANYVADNSILEVGPSKTVFTPGNGSGSKNASISTIPERENPLVIGKYGESIFARFDITIYELTISESGNVMHHYIPQRRLGTPGLYDENTGHFMTSEDAQNPLVAIDLTN